MTNYLRKLALSALCIGLSCGLSAYAQNGVQKIRSIGLYAYEPAEAKHYRFWRACGYNTLQFIDVAVSLPREQHQKFYDRIAKGIADAQRAGFKVGIIIQSNIAPYPREWWETYNPAIKDSMDARLNDIAVGVKLLSKADFFTFFGGDPGGSPVPLGQKGIERWMEMSRKVQSIVKREAPHAFYNANIWAVSHWDDKTFNPFYVHFWDKEVDYGKKIVATDNFINKDCGIEFPLHNYYRSLALKAYFDVKRAPEPYPVADDVGKLKARGVKRMWGWAHFLIDEVDDGYTGYSGTKRHPAQAETRYIHHLIENARKVGLNGMFSFTSGPGSEIEAMNVYAFGKSCTDASLTPEQGIDEFSGFIADKTSKHLLSQVIRFIENNSTWEASIPEKFQIEKLGCDLAGIDGALQALAAVKPNPDPSFPLPETPGEYLEKLRSRLKDIKAKDTAGKVELWRTQNERLKQDWACLKCFQEENRQIGLPKPGERRVVFMGNSITARWGQVDSIFFAGKPYFNRGVSGQITAQMLIRFRQDVIDLGPAAVVILGGTNDIAGIGGLVSVETVFGNIVSMAQLAKANGIRVVLCSVLPVFDYACCPGMEPVAKIADLNQRLKAYADKNDVVYLDYFTSMAAENKGMKTSLTSDGVHPNKEGYHIMEPLVDEAINKALKK